MSLTLFQHIQAKIMHSVRPTHSPKSDAVNTDITPSIVVVGQYSPPDLRSKKAPTKCMLIQHQIPPGLTVTCTACALELSANEDTLSHLTAP
eukprot:67894-Amphidinium_carterae.2